MNQQQGNIISMIVARIVKSSLEQSIPKLGNITIRSVAANTKYTDTYVKLVDEEGHILGESEYKTVTNDFADLFQFYIYSTHKKIDGVGELIFDTLAGLGYEGDRDGVYMGIMVAADPDVLMNNKKIKEYLNSPEGLAEVI